MKALVLRSYGQFVYTDFPLPKIGPDDVLINVKACGICGSDVHGMDGRTGRRRPPIIMGHEAAGVIVDKGANVTSWWPGDRVTFDSTVYCGECAFCKSGRVNLCGKRRVLGVSCGEYRMDGAFAEYVCVPQRVLYHLPTDLDFAAAALVEPVAIALHAVRRSGITAEDSAVVYGAGMIGLLLIQVLRSIGCHTIIAVDIDETKLKPARDLGATHTYTGTAEAVIEQVLNFTSINDIDHVFEAVGLSETVEASLDIVRKGGAVTLIGNLSPTIQFPLQIAITKEITIYGSCASAGEYPAALELIALGKVKVDPIISAVAPLSEGATWFNRLYAKEPGLLKVILEPTTNQPKWQPNIGELFLDSEIP